MNLLAAVCGNTTCVDTSPLNSGGVVDDRMQTVYTAVFWSSVALGSVVAALLLYSMFRFRRRSDDDEPKQFHSNTKLEVGWTLLPLVVFPPPPPPHPENTPFHKKKPRQCPHACDGDRRAVRLVVRLWQHAERQADPELRHAVCAGEHRGGLGGRVDRPTLQATQHACGRRDVRTGDLTRGMRGEPQLLRALAGGPDECDPRAGQHHVAQRTSGNLLRTMYGVVRRGPRRNDEHGGRPAKQSVPVVRVRQPFRDG